MRLLITGGAGFIGSHLVDYYLQHGDEVMVVDSLITGREDNIRLHQGKKEFTFIKEDICELRDVDAEIDLILHFASPASPIDYLKYPIETMRTASLGTYNLLEIAKNKRAKFLLASTSEIYGDPEQHPQGEEYWGNTFIVRIFNTYGQRMRADDGRLIPTLVNQALKNETFTIFGDGKQTRSFCYISDMVEGITRAAQTDYTKPVNLGNPKEFTILEVADMIKAHCVSNSEVEFLPLPENDLKKRKPNISRAKEILDWEPRIDLDTGLKYVIEWFRSEK
jgi:dTDP-glucose 4,6-dehydratase